MNRWTKQSQAQTGYKLEVWDCTCFEEIICKFWMKCQSWKKWPIFSFSDKFNIIIELKHKVNSIKWYIFLCFTPYWYEFSTQTYNGYREQWAATNIYIYDTFIPILCQVQTMASKNIFWFLKMVLFHIVIDQQGIKLTHNEFVSLSEIGC